MPEPISLADLAGFPVTTIKKIGPKKAEGLAKIGIESVLDLLTHYPRRYLDRSRQGELGSLPVGEEAFVVVTVEKVSSFRPRRGKPIVNVVVSDGTGRLTCTFFNQPWREKQLRPGQEAVMIGKVDVYRGSKQMANPIVDLVGGDKHGKIVPVYPQSEKASILSHEFGQWTRDALGKCAQRGIADPLPAAVRERFRFVDRHIALGHIHHPEEMAQVQEARRRLVFDELFRIQLELVRRKREMERTTAGIAHELSGNLVTQFHHRLAFPLTAAQARANAEIADDLAAAHPMHRLLQGDVGSGKTIVAVTALLRAIEGGYQGAFMAPTEVLAEQHYLGVRELLDGLVVTDAGASLFPERPLRVELLTNRTTAAERKRLALDLEAGTVDLLIGTHALIQDSVGFRALGVVVIDEQHRFGVEQRAALRDKGAGDAAPDVLVMTATPIPRTAAMTVYGDLDVSVLDELPPGRTPIATTWVDDDPAEAAMWDHVRREVADGHQAYVVCPLIEESEALDVRSAEDTYAELAAGELADLRLALLHGRLSSKDKEAVMGAFRAGDIDVVVSTTVIEVGVDVPNATIMVILDADRFGIAQLHQLRGRVGRGADASACYLASVPATPDGIARLEALVASTDGFELAEIDLDLRGEGTIMGERQKGQNDLKLASLRRDREWVEKAREAAIELIDTDPELEGHPDLAAEIGLFLNPDDADYLLKS